MKKNFLVLITIFSMLFGIFGPFGSVTAQAALDQTFWDQFSDRYFYNNMNQSQKALYDELDRLCRDFMYNRQDAKPLSARANGFPESLYTLPSAANYSGLSLDDAYNVYIIFSNANPQYYFLSAGAVGSSTGSGKTGIYACIYNEYSTAANRDYYNGIFESTMNGWINDVKSYSGSYEQVKRIYELIIEKMYYAQGAWDEHQSSATAVFTGTTVCAGYAEVFAMLAKACGIPVTVVTSKEHEWVQVQLDDGKWYNVDPTFDDNGLTPRWNYFAVPDEGFNSDGKHSPEPIYVQLGRPVCTGKYDPGAPKVETPIAKPETNIPQGTVYTGEKVDIYRLYNKKSGEHFYSSKSEERDNLVSSGWTYEGIAWKAPKVSDTPIYRLLNPNSGDHHYTTKAGERDYLVSVGWKSEGIGWYSDPNQGMPLYRLYNPNAKTGQHHYTNSVAERDFLVKSGWQNESVGFYATL